MKQIYIKSFDGDGEYIRTFNDFRISTFSKKINVGIGEMVVKLARKFDDFNSNDDVTLGNKLEVWITDEDTGTDPQKIYTGYVEQQIPRIENNDEYVEILCLSVASYLTQDILKSGSQTKLYTIVDDGLTETLGSKSAAEVSDVLKSIVEFFRENNSSKQLNYSTNDGDTIEDTGNFLDYTFNALQYSEAIKRCKDAAPQNWYWYIDENEILYFKAVPSEATHTFTIGKDISRIEVTKGLDSIKNIVLISDADSLYKQYKDDSSVTLYGRRVKQITDLSIGDETSMDNIGASFIAENKDPRIRIVMEIIDNNESEKGYDIDSIQPGETCKVVGISPEEELLTDNMIIQQVDWYDGYARITIETRQDFEFDAFLLKLRKDVDQQSFESTVPESYS